jgi:class 3 adenylate cyclase/tetratricopeptide (TPR) repeat protein
MKCPKCGAQNRESLRFCEDCGSRLAAMCPACGGDVSPDKKFCGACGALLAGTVPRTRDMFSAVARGTLENERKQVTVLFADMKGSMELLADRDPEEARNLLDPVLELMLEAVRHYDGTVNQVMGDGIMALFGAPLAREDHAIRACYAALRMRDSVRDYARQLSGVDGTSVQIRVGLNSGDVVVRSIASDLQMDYTAVGQTTHLASRMEQMARPGTIMATESCIRLAAGYVEVVRLGPQPIRGLSERVDAYEVTGIGKVRSRLDASIERGLSRFVGRDAELQALHRELDSAASGHGRVVAILGEPGAGKSRLIYELARSQGGRDWLLLETGATRYGRSTAYRPIMEMLRSHFGVGERDDADVVQDRVGQRLRALDETLGPLQSAFLTLLGVPVKDAAWRTLAPSRRRQEVLEAVTRLLVRESVTRPVCVVVEDLHWIDSETEAVLDALVESLPSARILLLVSHRPEYRHRWTGKSYYSQLRLDPLPAANAEELLDDFLGFADGLAPFKKLLIEKTAGNPFFLEECVRALVDTGALVGVPATYRLAKPIDTIEVPATVQAIIAARIDGLAADDKALLEMAAVIGKDVPFPLLHAIAGLSEEVLHRSLTRLRAAEVLYETRLFPDLEYTFRHALTHDVAYSNLLSDQRRILHGRIVRAIEELANDRVMEHVEQLARHSRGARLWDRAARYLRQAGAKAFAHSANREAVVWLQHALEALKHLAVTTETLTETADVHLELRNALTLLGEHQETLAHLREAEALAERTGDDRRLGRALSFEVNCLYLLGDHERAIEASRRAHALADRLDDVPLRIVTSMYTGRAYLRLGEFSRAIEIFEGIVATLTGALAQDHLGLPVLPAVFARSLLVEALAAVGRFEEGARHAHEAVELAETTDHPDTRFWAYHGLGVHHLERGELGPAAEALERGYVLCQAYGMPTHIPRITSELGRARALEGRTGDAIPMLQRAAEEAARRRQAVSYPNVLLHLGEVWLLAGRLTEAADAAASALGLFRRQRERGHEASALRLLGDIAGQIGSDDAEGSYDAARALARELGMRPLAARCEAGLALLFRRRGQSERAIAAFQLACREFGELGMQADLSRCDAELKALR